MEGDRALDIKALTRDIQTSITRLDEFKGLKPDWNSYGAAPIDLGTIETMRKLLEAFTVKVATSFREQLTLPESFFVAPLSDGGVQIELEGSCGLYLAIEIDPRDGISYFFEKPRDGSFQEEGQDGITFVEALEILYRAVTA